MQKYFGRLYFCSCNLHIFHFWSCRWSIYDFSSLICSFSILILFDVALENVDLATLLTPALRWKRKYNFYKFIDYVFFLYLSLQNKSKNFEFQYQILLGVLTLKGEISISTLEILSCSPLLLWMLEGKRWDYLIDGVIAMKYKDMQNFRHTAQMKTCHSLREKSIFFISFWSLLIFKNENCNPIWILQFHSSSPDITSGHHQI